MAASWSTWSTWNEWTGWRGQGWDDCSSGWAGWCENTSSTRMWADRSSQDLWPVLKPQPRSHLLEDPWSDGAITSVSRQPTSRQQHQRPITHSSVRRLPPSTEVYDSGMPVQDLPMPSFASACARHLDTSHPDHRDYVPPPPPGPPPSDRVRKAPEQPDMLTEDNLAKCVFWAERPSDSALFLCVFAHDRLQDLLQISKTLQHSTVPDDSVVHEELVKDSWQMDAFIASAVPEQVAGCPHKVVAVHSDGRPAAYAIGLGTNRRSYERAAALAISAALRIARPKECESGDDSAELRQVVQFGKKLLRKKRAATPFSRAEISGWSRPSDSSIGYPQPPPTTLA